MDPSDKSPHLPSGRPVSTRRMPSPAERVSLAPASAAPSPSSSRSHTTLPPIHQLHPGLAHTSMHPPPPPQGSGSPRYMQGATYPLASTSTLGVRGHPEDSDPETSQGRPKQKRRRQALSCTECKRRKIKCDRANPCGPCVRRGEQGKCQWHVIEPMEKYVTRSEFDDLKARVAELEATLMRVLPGSSPPAPTSRRPSMSATMTMSSGHPAELVHGTAITPYQAYSAPSAASYPPRPGSPRSPTRGELPPFYRPPPSAAGRSPTTAYRAPPAPGTPARAGATLRLPPPASPPTRRSPVRAPSPGSSGASGSAGLRLPAPASSSTTPSVRRSSISLAEITTPYNHEPKPQPPREGPKNRRAQATPPPGRRLRQCTPPGPAFAQASPRRRIHIVDLRQQVPV